MKIIMLGSRHIDVPDLLFVIFLLVNLVWPFLLMKGQGKIFWLTTMGIVALTVFMGEVISKYWSGRTLSRYFWYWSQEDPGSAIVVLGVLFLAWLGLLVHLAWWMVND